MVKKHTYCFRYYNINRDICYAWVEAPSIAAAKIIFDEQYKDCFRPIDVNETFNWK